MSGRRGRPTTSGKSHNKRSSTYATSRADRDNPTKKSKSIPSSNLLSFFKPVAATKITEEVCVTEEPNATEEHTNTDVDVQDMPSGTDVHAMTEHSDSEDQSDSTEPSDTEEDLSEEEIMSDSSDGYNENNVARGVSFDGRSSKASFTEKWERKYNWSYYSSLKGGWFCKTCEEYSDSYDEFWKTLPRRHDAHPGTFFREHESSDKHKKAISNRREIKLMLSKGNVVRQINKGMENKTAKDRKRNRNLIKKFLKTIYFLARKKWAVKNNFEDILKFIADIGDEDIYHHLKNAPGNMTYTSTTSVEQFLKVIGDYLEEKLITDLLAAGDFTVLADESTDEGDRSQMSVFVRFVDSATYKPVERYFGMVKLTTSKKAIDLHETIVTLIKEKGINPSFIRFSGLDGTNAMSGERKGLQRLLRHTAPHAQYLNCRNHRLALCLVHLIPRYQKLRELDGLLISVWKTFKYSSIKQSIFDEAQATHDMKPVKILNACVTRWLTHGESCARIISRFEPLIDALDTIFFERGDAEAKGVRDQLLEPGLLLMMLLLAEVLAPINNLSKFLQTSTLLYTSVTTKVNSLIDRLHKIKDGLENHDSVDTNLKFFNRATTFLQISSERNDLGRNLRGRTRVGEEPNVLVTSFLARTGYSFMDDLIREISDALIEENPILLAFNVFNLEDQSNDYRQDQLNILSAHYGDNKIDNYENDVNRADALINAGEVTGEVELFFEEFHDSLGDLNSQLKRDARLKMAKGELTQNTMEDYLYQHRVTATNVYVTMSTKGCMGRVPNIMKLFKLALMIPPSTSGVERGFSVMNLLISPLRTTLNERNVDRLMRICLDGTEKFTENELEEMVDSFKNSAPRRIAL